MNRGLQRKFSREWEIDALLAEEFASDPSFVRRFLTQIGLAFEADPPVSVTIQPPLLHGTGDLLVEIATAEGIVGLLIENKITASAQPRQAERYRETARRRLGENWAVARTVLVAPEGYHGERELYDAFLSLEWIAENITAATSARLAHRREIIFAAMRKKAAAGVVDPSEAVRTLWLAHHRFLAEYRASTGSDLKHVKPLRTSYHRREAWVRLGSGRLPEGTFVRHKLWSIQSARCGEVNLVLERVHGTDFPVLPPDTDLSGYGSDDRGIAVTKIVPEITADRSIERSSFLEAFEAADMLICWAAGNASCLGKVLR